jgi:hypothetical protein
MPLKLSSSVNENEVKLCKRLICFLDNWLFIFGAMVSANNLKSFALQKKNSDGKLKLPNVNDIPDSNPASKLFKVKEEKDYEGQMARAQLQIIAKRAAALTEMMTDDMELEAWVQSKITMAEDYVTTVHDYMTTRRE